MKNKNRRITTGALMALVIAIIANFAVPVFAAQPGTAEDPLVTRRYFNAAIEELTNEIAILRALIAGGANLPAHQGTFEISGGDTDAIMADLMRYIDSRLAAMEFAPGYVDFTTPPQMPPFTVLHTQAGQVLTFEAGAEFILRGGGAIAITGPYNGIPDVTAANDVMNGTLIGLNHLMMIPVTDGRGVLFTAESWIMVRGGYNLLG